MTLRSPSERLRLLRVISAACMGVALISAVVAIGLGGPVQWGILLGMVGGVTMVASSYLQAPSVRDNLSRVGIASTVISLGALVWTLLAR